MSTFLQVKSTRWVADGLRELKDSKQFKRNSLVEGNSTKRPAKQSVKNGKYEPENVTENYDVLDNHWFVENIRIRKEPSYVYLNTMENNAAPETSVFWTSESVNVNFLTCTSKIKKFTSSTTWNFQVQMLKTLQSGIQIH